VRFYVLRKKRKKINLGFFFFSVKSKFWLVYVLLYTRIDLSFVQKLKVEFIKVNHIFLKKIELKVKNNQNKRGLRQFPYYV
jgi:hypothetical protein